MVLSDDLKWNYYTDFIVDKCMTRIWIIRRLRKLSLDDSFLYDLFIKEIRSVLGYGAPIWNGNLSETNSDKIEQIQKRVLKIILSHRYTSYEDACEHFGTVTLKQRREILCIRFARKDFKKDASIFRKFQPKFTSRSSGKKVVEEIFCYTDHYFNSSIPYLARLLNKHGLGNA